MARDHARIKTDIWTDDDFLDLTPQAQFLYFVITTQRKLSFCGVMDWRPAGIAQLAKGWTAQKVEEAAKELSDNHYLIIDPETEEALVRSFIRNDGVLTSPNIAKAMFSAYSAAYSRTIRAVIVHELKRLHAENPLLKGWESCSDLLDKRALDPTEIPKWNPSINPSNTAEPNPSVNTIDTPYSLLPTPSSPPPTPLIPAKSRYTEAFERVYALYPIKVGKKAAAASFERAIKEISVDELALAVARYRDDPNRDTRFTKNFSTWLNQGCWDDEPLPDRRGPMSKQQENLVRGQALTAKYAQLEGYTSEPFQIEA